MRGLLLALAVAPGAAIRLDPVAPPSDLAQPPPDQAAAPTEAVAAAQEVSEPEVTTTERPRPTDCDLPDSFPANCSSFYEVERNGQCVMAHELPQYTIGKDVLETIDAFERTMKAYYQNTKTLTRMINMTQQGQQLLADKIASSIMGTKKFVVGSLGSSVTAGHDNCHVDAYPEQLGRLVAPIFKQAGVEFLSRNGGLGGHCGDTFVNQAYCLEHIAGSDADVTHYSWDYFGDSSGAQEDFIRASLMMPRQAMPMILSLGHDSDAIPLHNRFAELYGDLGYHALFAMKGLVESKRVPETGWESRAFKWGFKGDGLHNWTRSAAQFPATHCRRKSSGILWRNWHGGPMLYQTISDALGWMYVQALKVALEKVKNKSASRSARRVTLPKGHASQLNSTPRCIMYNKPSFTQEPAFTLLEGKGQSIAYGPARVDNIASYESDEPICEHLDRCGAITGKPSLTYDLQPKGRSGLENGTIVICLGGKKPPPAGTLAAPPEHKKPKPNLLEGGLESEGRMTGTALIDQMELEQEAHDRVWGTGAQFPSCGIPGKVLIVGKKTLRRHCSVKRSGDACYSQKNKTRMGTVPGYVTSVLLDGKELIRTAREWIPHHRETHILKCGAFDVSDKNARMLTIRSQCPITHIFAL